MWEANGGGDSAAAVVAVVEEGLEVEMGGDQLRVTSVATTCDLSLEDARGGDSRQDGHRPLIAPGEVSDDNADEVLSSKGMDEKPEKATLLREMYELVIYPPGCCSLTRFCRLATEVSGFCHGRPY